MPRPLRGRMPLELQRTHPILRVHPALREYGWGDPRTIPRLMGIPATGGPIAEAWFGTHPRASARVDGQCLGSLIAADPVGLLGHSVRDRFGTLPYLLKVLAARQPLSVQVHPDREQARRGHAREQRAGIPVDARHRCYPDPRPKAELLVALTPFTLLAGMRSLPELERALGAVPEVASLLPPVQELGGAGWVSAYLRLPDAVVGPALQHWMARDRGLPAEIHRRMQTSVPDRGLVFALLLEHLELAPGEGVFVGPGLLHAYLGGTALELAASSDNVVRAGLTHKHVDRDELLRVVRWDASAVRRIPAGPEGAFASETSAFRLHHQSLQPGAPIRRVANGPETVLALPARDDVCVRISWREGSMDLERGHACLVPHGVAYALAATGEASVYRAVVPV